jgi:hypothetical protein
MSASMDPELDVADLIDGFPVEAPWLGCGAIWFDDAAPSDRARLEALFAHAAATAVWPGAPDVPRSDDPALLAWVSATVHVVTRLRRETVAFAEQLLAPRSTAWTRGLVTEPTALGPSLDAIECARQRIDAVPSCIAMAVALNSLTLELADTGVFPAPPRALARYVDLDGRHWADATYRHHRGPEFYRRLDVELAHARAGAPWSDPSTPWDLHAWVYALVTLLTGTPAPLPSA